MVGRHPLINNRGAVKPAKLVGYCLEEGQSGVDGCRWQAVNVPAD